MSTELIYSEAGIDPTHTYTKVRAVVIFKLVTR